MNDLLERALKGWVTSILGLLIMLYSLWRWDQGYLEDNQAIIVGLIGMILVFVKDKVPEYIGRLFDKFTGNTKPPQEKP